MYLCILSYFLNQFYYSYIKKFQSHSKRTDENGLIFLTIIKSENICKIYGLKPLCSQSVLAVRFENQSVLKWTSPIINLHNPIHILVLF